jgi:thiol-disulfide isomerase/thioredoxin
MVAVAPIYLHDLPSDLEWVNSNPVPLSALRGRVSLFHFWAGSSIHCQQALAEIKSLEGKFIEGFCVIGVHTPKHNYESSAAVVLKTINRWFIRHPVINDPQWRLWRRFAVPAWPTSVLLDAEGKLVGMYVGEGQKAALEAKITALIGDAAAKGIRSLEPALIAKKPEARTFLQFPSKLCASAERLYIADTSHNRVLECSFAGRVTRIFGSGNAGFWDGAGAEAGMREPTGICIGKDMLFICDTGNHAIRRVRFLAGDQLDTIAGNGRQGNSAPEDGPSKTLMLASPTDCVFHLDKLYVSLAGRHQVWAFDLLRNNASRVAGSGDEGVADGALMAANFAQPSALALGKEFLYVLDSASSALRQVRLNDLVVSTLIGEGLYDCGDSDGPGSLAKLQHPTAACFDHQRNVLWIADSYNNKIKVFSPGKNEVKTLNVNYKLQEPAGLTLADNALWIANQNAHELLRLDLKSGKLTRVPVGEN